MCRPESRSWILGRRRRRRGGRDSSAAASAVAVRGLRQGEKTTRLFGEHHRAPPSPQLSHHGARATEDWLRGGLTGWRRRRSSPSPRRGEGARRADEGGDVPVVSSEECQNNFDNFVTLQPFSVIGPRGESRWPLWRRS